MLGSCMNFFGAKLLESSEKAAAPTSGMHRNHPTVLELLFFCVFYFLTVFRLKGMVWHVMDPFPGRGNRFFIKKMSIKIKNPKPTGNMNCIWRGKKMGDRPTATESKPKP